MHRVLGIEVEQSGIGRSVHYSEMQVSVSCVTAQRARVLETQEKLISFI